MQLRKLSLVICLMTFSAASWAETVLVKSQHQIEEYKLDNGLRVILAPNDKENKVYLNTVYLTGSLNDPKSKGGLAHLLEHLAFKGTVDVKGEEFQRRLDQYTLFTNASTDYHSTKYINVVRPDQNAIDQVLYLEAQRMDKLVLQEKFVPSEIAIVMREREVRMDQPFSVLMDQVWKNLYGNQSLGRLPIGDLDELKSINMAELNQFYRDYYAPNNAIIVVSGKFDKATMLKKIEEKFGIIAARKIAESAKVPAFDINKMKQRDFTVQKGSDQIKLNMYVGNKDPNIQSILAISPALMGLVPSGHLYKDLVETGIANDSQVITWLDQDFNLVFVAAVYSPQQDVKKIDQSLIKTVEQAKPFTQSELDRVKNLVKNQGDAIQKDASALGARLADYVVSADGQWDQFFVDLKRIEKLSLSELNQQLTHYFVPEKRLSAHILPTPEDQKKAQQQQAETLKALDEQAAPEPLKDAVEYRTEAAEYLKKSQQYLQQSEQKIQRGQFANGLQYALFPTKTIDGKSYAKITIQFGTAEALFNKGPLLDLTAYLLLRASERYSLQDIADKSIAAGGSASAEAIDNGIAINIVANHEQFADYFQYIVEVLKNPSFEQSQFDLIKQQSLLSLDRPYTEPEVVAALTMSRLTETYQPGDLRYHFEPDLQKKQLDAATREQVQQLYRQFFAMNHAQIAMTGDFDPKAMQKVLKKQLATWSNKEKYQPLSSSYTRFQPQKHHVLAEQREFGNYQALLTMPVSQEHPDAPALMVLSYILGDSQLSSRLGLALREHRALVYGFASHISLDDQDEIGALFIEANYSAGKANEVSQVVHKALADLVKSGVTEQELAAAKANILKKRVTRLEDDRAIHAMLNHQLRYNKKMADRAVRDQAFARLTTADLHNVIRKYIKPEQLLEVMADQYGQDNQDIQPAAIQSK
ncbi:M16 family metallopeptidase [Acinetobacter larvae]|uniref:Peptidase M16 n=1 Tax=Acinetobacter larvae TaxID=1789224 RepID=A0A1B2M177_9GAMM|nr:M16 family metallopeptidase [Acinetobacter larvae]AOA58950.1 peptidase M16 [Acinetobacter larvae]